MKFVVILSVLFLISATDKVFAESEVIKLLTGQCQQDEGATDQDLADAVNLIFPETATGKCLMACLSEKGKAFGGNKLLKDGYMAFVGMLTGNDPDKMEKALKGIEACEDVTDESRCEAVYKIFKCLEANGIENGLILF